jgi:hypothetical protein
MWRGFATPLRECRFCNTALDLYSICVLKDSRCRKKCIRECREAHGLARPSSIKPPTLTLPTQAQGKAGTLHGAIQDSITFQIFTRPDVEISWIWPMGPHNFSKHEKLSATTIESFSQSKTSGLDWFINVILDLIAPLYSRCFGIKWTMLARASIRDGNDNLLLSLKQSLRKGNI